MTSQTIKCNCVSEFQDSAYGKGNRLGNVMKSGQVRCTVCSKLAGSSSGAPLQAEKVATKLAAKTETKPVAVKKESPKEDKKDNKGKKSLKGTKR